MIDVENMVFTALYNAIKTAFPKAEVSGEYNETPSAFPFISIVEENNTPYRKTLDDSLKEHHANLMYTINIYSAKANGKKAEAKAIQEVVDSTLQNLKFTRSVCNRIPNTDRTIYRIVSRYSLIVQESYTDGNGNKVYQVYRK